MDAVQISGIKWETIIVALIAATPAVLVGVATLLQGIRTHKTFNSKMDKMLKLTSEAAFARGVKQEKDAVKKSNSQPTSNSKKKLFGK